MIGAPIGARRGRGCRLESCRDLATDDQVDTGISGATIGEAFRVVRTRRVSLSRQAAADGDSVPLGSVKPEADRPSPRRLELARNSRLSPYVIEPADRFLNARRLLRTNPFSRDMPRPGGVLCRSAY